MKYCVPALALALLVAAPDARAQSSLYRGVELWVGGATWAGDDAEDFNPGVRGGVRMFAEASPRVGIGIEALLGRFDLESSDAANEIGLGAVGRIALGDRSSMHAFAEGRAGWHRISASDELVDVTQDGFSVGPGLGVEIPAGRTTRLILSSEATWKTYRDARLFTNSLSAPDTGGSVFQFGVSIGVAFGTTP